jgi:hypothetical protein
MLKQYFRDKIKRPQPIGALLVVLAVAAIGTYLLTGSHAASPYASITADKGSSSGGAVAQSCSGASDGNCVVFGAPPVSSSSFSLATTFPIGVDQQPTTNFSLWKSRGVNTVVDVPEGNNQAAWDSAALADGLYEMREPSDNPASDVGIKNLIAWDQPDEPDGIDTQVPYTTIDSDYNSWKAIDPSLPVYINFTGGLDQYNIKDPSQNGPSWYEQYVAGADWITSDDYPVNDGQPLTIIGTEVAALKAISGGKPVFVFIETGAYDSSNPVITANQFNGEFWQAIIAGVRGIWYFPIQVTPTFSFDVTPAAVATQMTADDATVTQLASAIQGTVNPTSIGATVSSPLQVGWRSASGSDYFIVLNLSNNTENNEAIKLSGIGSATSATVYGENRSVQISGNSITDNFAPYAEHIYQVQ